MIIRKLVLLIFLFPVFALAETTSTLTIYAPDYFISEWGPGPKIKEAFERKCSWNLKYVSGDPLSKLMLEGKSTLMVLHLNSPRGGNSQFHPRNQFCTLIRPARQSYFSSSALSRHSRRPH